MTRHIVFISVALACVSGRLTAQRESRVSVQVGALGRALHERMLTLTDSGFSGAVVVEVHDTLVLEAGYGLANRERHVPFTATTIAQIGSITKSFTAAAIADLARQGRVKFSDSLAQYFPNLPKSVRGITVDMLLSHTAGLREECGEDFDRVTQRDLLGRCLALPLTHPPGTAFEYSNLGYSVLGALVERIAHEPLEKYLHEHFFRPLGLPHIGYAFPAMAADSFASGYVNDAGRGNIRDSIAPLGADFWNLKGNGGMQATVDEMYRWYHELQSGSIVTADMRKAMFSRHAERDPGVYYGYGWFLRLDSLGRATQISHSGSDGTFVALWLWRPTDHVFIYTVTNFGQNDLASGAASRILAVIRQR